MYRLSLREKRFQRNARIKQQRREHAQKWWGNQASEDRLNRSAGMRYHTAALCSCAMCGNPRKHFNRRSIQELRWMQDLDLKTP